MEYQLIDSLALIALLHSYLNETDENIKLQILEQMKIQIQNPGAQIEIN